MDSLYGVAFVCVGASIVQGFAVSLLHPGFGTFWDSRLGFFTMVDIASFAPFAYVFSSRKLGVWSYFTAYAAIVLAAPGAFFEFDMFMWNSFGAADGIYFPALALGLLALNFLLFRSSREATLPQPSRA